MSRLVALVGVIAAATIACGGAVPEREQVSREELRQLLGDVSLEIGVAFHRVDEVTRHGEAQELRGALLRAADTEEHQVRRLERVAPPQEARRPIARLVRATREQASDIRALARRRDLSAELVNNDSLREDRSDREIDAALAQLDALGLGSASGR